jgi:LacI family transcriptional regulator
VTRSRKSGLTAREIADRIGVSVATVSRVARGVGQVSPEMREKVIRAIEQSGYRPSHLGQALAGQRHAALGVIYPSLAGPYYSEVIEGFEVEAARAHQSLMILRTNMLDDSKELALEKADRVDGIAVMGGSVSEEVFGALIGHGGPLVQFAGVPLAGVPTVRTESAHSVRRLTLHLIRDHGYTRLAFAGRPAGSPDVSRRWDGFRAAHREAGLRVPASPVEVGFEQHDGVIAAQRLLNQAALPRAIVCANDEMAVGVVLTILGHGLRVPDDIAVIGFDDIPMATYMEPALTTVHVPKKYMGEMAVKRLNELVNDDSHSPVKILVSTKIKKRRSL